MQIVFVFLGKSVYDNYFLYTGQPAANGQVQVTSKGSVGYIELQHAIDQVITQSAELARTHTNVNVIQIHDPVDDKDLMTLNSSTMMKKGKK